MALFRHFASLTNMHFWFGKLKLFQHPSFVSNFAIVSRLVEEEDPATLSSMIHYINTLELAGDWQDLDIPELVRPVRPG